MTKENKKWLTKDVINWSLFDFANSTFATIIVAFVYAIYFKKVVANDQPIGDFYWSLSINISMITVALLSPLLGAASDQFANKKKFLIGFTFLAIITTALMFFIREGMLLQGMLLFILANIGFQAGLGFYDAFLKEISSEENYNRVSSFGYAIGYAGSLLSLVAVILLKDEPRNTFIACAGMFLIFSLPMFVWLKEKSLPQPSQENFVSVGIKRLKDTFHHLAQYKNLRTFLLSYFIYIDGVTTIIFFSANYAQTTLSFSITELIIFFVVVQITALIGSFLFGSIADKIGTKKTLLIIIGSWMVLTLAIFFITDKTQFIVIGGFAGTLLGSSQALSRSLMGELTPDNKKAEFFGFFSLFEKTSTILGPLTFGLVSWLSGNQRFAIISIIFFFIFGWLMLRKVEEKPA